MNFVIKKSSFLFSSLVKMHTDPATKATTVTLSNPKKRNTLSAETIEQLSDTIQMVQKSIEAKQTKIMILKAEGPVFCSGHDLKSFAASKQNASKAFQKCTKTLLTIKSLQVPTISVVNGIAAAAGFQLALTCDLMLCSDKSSFSTPGVKWGLFCSTPGVQLIRSITSEKKAMEMLLFGQPISAQDALQYGLVNKVVPEDQLDKEVDIYIQKMQHLSGEVIAMGKKIYAQQIGKDIETAYCTAIEGMKRNIEDSEDCQEGLKAFTQKRHPTFRN